MHKTQAVSMEERSNNSCSSEGSIDLDLSAGSSIFEGIDSNIQLGTQPYLFEPEADIDEEATTGNSPSPASDNSDRLGNNDWYEPRFFFIQAKFLYQPLIIQRSIVVFIPT